MSSLLKAADSHFYHLWNWHTHTYKSFLLGLVAQVPEKTVYIRKMLGVVCGSLSKSTDNVATCFENLK